MSKLKLTTLATQDDSASVPADTIVNGTAKAWVNFNGTGAVAIRRAFNVSSVTDNGTGDYTVNFTTAMVDANYPCFASTGNPAMAGTSYANQVTNCGRQTTTSFRILNTAGGSLIDSGQVSASAFS
jgi:hypothetical protein